VFHVDLPAATPLAIAGAAGVAAGLWLLGRGFVGYREAGRIGGTSTSRIASIAAGEVLISGRVTPSEVLLVSPLQSTECVYFRARIGDTSEGDGDAAYREDRAVGFRVDDGTGTVRIFPRGARFDVPFRYDETASDSDGLVGFRPRSGPLYAPGAEDRANRIAELLTVRRSGRWNLTDDSGLPLRLSGDSRRRYREARIEPGDVVTVVGRAMPFGDLDDPTEANVVDDTGLDLNDPEIAGDIAEARAAGTLEMSPEQAWGNAAIPGFGIGRPVRMPDLDPDADPLPLATPEAAARSQATFAIAPETLVIASGPGTRLDIGMGAPATLASRAEWQFLVGLLGAVFAIGSAVVLAAVAGGAIR
jgi:hypothetical protein